MKSTANPMDELAKLWEAHRDSEWPKFASPDQGELMTLDTVISGCATCYLESPDGLDDQRRAILFQCLDDLQTLLPHIPEEAADYFTRLHRLAWLLHHVSEES
ncbi:hypothetical protein [Nitrospira tepida]|nr:hypothetical protein [Nitrospira tepida]